MKQLQESRLRSRTGFALPLTIFLVSIISVMLATTFTRTATEHLVAGSTASEVAVLAVAQSGLQAFLGDTNILTRPVLPDSFRYNVAGGYAWVKPEPMQIPADTLAGTFQYIVRSTGYHIVPEQGSTPQATRSVAQFAFWQPGFIRPTGALTSIPGFSWDAGGSAVTSINGNDDPTCAVLDSTGFRAPAVSAIPPGVTGTIPATMVGGTRLFVANATGVDWDAIVNQGAIVPDYLSIINGDNNFYTYYLAGDMGLANINGTGLLIIAGALIPSGTFQWDGLILVGGVFDINNASSFTVNGMIVAGLNELLGLGPVSSLLNADGHDLDIQYNSCNVRQALRKFYGFVPIENAWVDNWATY